MPWDGAGSFVRTDGTRTGSDVWSQAKAAGRKIVKEDHDIHDEDLADGLEAALNRFGENAMAANLAMGGFKATGLGVGSARTDSISLGQVQDGGFRWGGVSSGQNVVAISLTPAITAYTNGMVVWFQKNATPNTASMAININAIGQKNLLKSPGIAIGALEMAANAVVQAIYVESEDDFFVLSGLTPEATLGKGFIGGLGLSQDTDADHDILVSAGACRDDANTGNIVLGTEITKRIDAVWSVGDNAGGLDGGSVAADTYYGVFAIRRLDTGVVDVIFSVGSDAPTLPTNYTLYRRIGWVLTDGSANIVDFVQQGERFLWATPVNDFSDTQDATAALIAVTAPPLTNPIISVSASNTTELRYLLVSSPAQASAAVSATVHNVYAPDRDQGAFNGVIFDGTYRSDSSRRLRFRANAGIDIRVLTMGWHDDRGRNA